jgi:hypothetical protein
MMRALAVVIALGACTKAGPKNEPSPQPPTTDIAPVTTTTPPPTTPPATVGKVTVVMTAATLADDCGGSAPWTPPTAKYDPPPMKSKGATQPIGKEDSNFADMASEPKGRAKMARRRCEQTSMQLAVTAAAGASPAKLQVKKVELFDQNGKSLGELAASKPTRWTEKSSAYEAWDESVVPDQKLSVSYVLAQPKWDAIPDRMNKTYTVKAIITVDGGDQTVSKDVEVRAPTILPPGVKT